MRKIETGIDIAAPAATVWKILTDFEAYPAWNPFIISIEGVARAGEKLTIRIKPPGQSPMTLKPTLLAAVPGQELRWLGHLLMPGLFDGRHEFLIEERGGACRFRQNEQFTGLLLFIVGAKGWVEIGQGFEAMNLALKQRAEA